MSHITDDEREEMIKAEYPEYEFERVDIREDNRDNFFWKNGQNWTFYDLPEFALGCLDILTPPHLRLSEEWKSRHWVEDETYTRWYIKRNKDKKES